ncbi:hypothetical protein [Neobacillus mesonae]|uniref:hypothetical protein n=1 Tax=Neobacillus mesonae TaxID=1193713 RepID=UPI000AFE54F8|nr:hypothetical protein [Neobacillus mesonae]
MTNNSNNIQALLGIDIRARSSNKVIWGDHDSFKNPIIHKKINGQVIVPLDITRLWGR